MSEIIMTEELLQAGCSRRGSWSNQQLALLGVPTPLPAGWRKRLPGTRIPKANYDKFLALKNRHLKDETPEFPRQETGDESRQSVEEENRRLRQLVIAFRAAGLEMFMDPGDGDTIRRMEALIYAATKYTVDE